MVLSQNKEAGKMLKKFKFVSRVFGLATLLLVVLTACVYAYNSSLEEHFDVFFCLRETESTENYTEIFEPLDSWTRSAIENPGENILVPWENLTEWLLYPYWKTGLKGSHWDSPNIIFKYHDQYYKFDFPDVFWTPAPPPGIPLGPFYSGLTITSLGWVSTEVYVRKCLKHKGGEAEKRSNKEEK